MAEAWVRISAQLFSGRYDFDTGTPRSNFDNFWKAFLTMFQVPKALVAHQLLLLNGMHLTSLNCNIFNQQLQCAG